MDWSLVTTKGQIVIPSKIRRKMGIRPGTKVCFKEKGGELILKPITDQYIDSLRGSLSGKRSLLKTLTEE